MNYDYLFLIAIIIIALALIVGLVLAFVRIIKRIKTNIIDKKRYSNSYHESRKKSGKIIDENTDTFGFDGTTNPPAEAIFGDVGATRPIEEDEPVYNRSKFCSNCGAPIEDGEKYCSSCGSKIDQ